MSSNIIRFGKGTLGTNFINIYQVPVDFLGIVKTMTFANTTGSDVAITVKLDDIEVMSERNVEPNSVVKIKAFDHILESGETIELKASVGGAINYYINGVIAPIENIACETQWMKDRWDEWWEQLGPVKMESDWQAWFNEIQDATYVTQTDLEDKVNEEMNVYEIEFNSKLSDIQDAADDAINRVDGHITDEIINLEVHGLRVNNTSDYMEYFDGEEWQEITSSEIVRLERESEIIRQNQVSLMIESQITSELGLDEVGYWYDSLANDNFLATGFISDTRLKVVH